MADSRTRSRSRFASGGGRSLARTEDCDFHIKAILLGDLGVGKTTFLYTFLRARHSGPRAGEVPDSLTQCPASGSRQVRFHGKRVKLTLWDTAGQERFRSLTASYYRGAQACIIMYDVNNVQSFEHVPDWIESVSDYSEPTMAMFPILVGSGSSTEGGQTNPAFPTATATTRHRPVEPERAERLACNYQIPHFRLDLQQDPKGLDFVLDTLVTLVMSRASLNHHLSQTIRPHRTKLDTYPHTDSQESKCSRCCNL